jgi:hypothetical protein
MCEDYGLTMDTLKEYMQQETSTLVNEFLKNQGFMFNSIDIRENKGSLGIHINFMDATKESINQQVIDVLQGKLLNDYNIGLKITYSFG